MKKIKRYDKASKDLINEFEEQIIEYVIKSKPQKIEKLDRELNLPDRRIDSVFKIDDRYVLNIEFQTEYEENIEFRVLLYNILLQVKHELPVRTIIIYLTRKNESKMKNFHMSECFGSKINFNFEVLKVWELNTDEILNKNIYGMYPLLALSRKDEKLPKIIYDKIIRSDIDNDKKESLLKVLSTLLNLVYKGETIKEMLPVEKLEGLLEKVRTESKNEGKLEGEESKSKNLLIRLINKKFKKISKKLEDKINKFNDIKKIESIIENIFDINSIEEIETILNN